MFFEGEIFSCWKARKPFEAMAEERRAKIYFFSTYEIVLEGALVDIAAAAQVNSPPSPFLLVVVVLSFTLRDKSYSSSSV